jgi:hypothetical protein
MKFQFAKDYTTQISVGGVVGVQNKTFKAGEIYDGFLPIGGGAIVSIKWGNENALTQVTQGYSPFVNIPYDVLVLDANGVPKDVTNDPLATERANQATSTNQGNTTNWKTLAIVAGVIAVGYYLFKKKIIKIN